MKKRTRLHLRLANTDDMTTLCGIQGHEKGDLNLPWCKVCERSATVRGMTLPQRVKYNFRITEWSVRAINTSRNS